MSIFEYLGRFSAFYEKLGLKNNIYNVIFKLDTSGRSTVKTSSGRCPSLAQTTVFKISTAARVIPLGYFA